MHQRTRPLKNLIVALILSLGPGSLWGLPGDVDLQFNAGVVTNPPAYSIQVAVQPDGKAILGGAFTHINGISRNYIARLNSGGSVDGTFLNNLTGANGQVYSVALQTNGQVLIGGAFTLVNGVTRNRLARLNSDGSLDNAFLNGLPGVNDWVEAMAIQPDGKILIGGYFSMVHGQTRNLLARLNADGSLDGAFLNGLSGINNGVFSILRQTDGKIVIGGAFTVVNGVTRNGVARLNTDGSLDETFLNGLSGANDNVNALALQTDGKIVAVGSFTLFNGITRNRIVRLNTDGSVDNAFLNGESGADGFVYSVKLQPDGRILIGGSFTMVNDFDRRGVARLHTNGIVDEWFLFGLPGANDRIGSMAVQPDGHVLIGGDFTSINGVTRNQVARLVTTYGPPVMILPQNILQQFLFYVTGTPGDTMVIEASTDLKSWSSIQTNLLGNSPPGYSEQLLFPRRFYRLRKL